MFCFLSLPRDEWKTEGQLCKNLGSFELTSWRDEGRRDEFEMNLKADKEVKAWGYEKKPGHRAYECISVSVSSSFSLT